MRKRPRKAKLREVLELIEQIRPILAGKNPDAIGAALAELQATLYAGMQGIGVEQLREELMAMHMRMVRNLIPICEREMLDRGEFEQ